MTTPAGSAPQGAALAQGTPSPGASAPGRGGRGQRAFSWQTFVGVPFILPSFIILFIVMIFPIFATGYFSLTQYSVLRAPEWLGLGNYVNLTTDPGFLKALWITLLYTAITVPLQTILALFVADLIARRFRNRFGSFVRGALFIPVMSSMVVVAVVWRALLGTDGGLVNNVLSTFGFGPVNFLGQPTLALITVAAVSAWKNIGYFLVIYYAGLMEVPGELYEASAIDGCNRWQQMVNITIPALRPVTFLVVILGTIWSFQVFDLVYVMTGGGPGGATTTIVMKIYEAGFKNFQMGYASAMAMLLFVLVLGVAVIQRKVMKNSASE